MVTAGGQRRARERQISLIPETRPPKNGPPLADSLSYKVEPRDRGIRLTVCVVRLILRCAAVVCLAVWPGAFCHALSINEIRTHQFGIVDTEHYFELAGNPGESLDSLTYLVIGDASNNRTTGIIEAVVNLSGLTIPGDGYFLVSESTLGLPGTVFAGIVADVQRQLNFEDFDNVTHLLVDGFFGAINDDIDANNDGQLNDGPLPWASVIDAVGFVHTTEMTGPSTEYVYGALLGGVDIGPAEDNSAPTHLYRTPDGDGAWQIGSCA